MTRFRRIGLAVLGITTAVLVALRIDPAALTRALIHADSALLLAALPLAAVNILAQYGKWEILVRISDSTASRSAVWMSLLAGFAAGFATPARAGEFVARGAGLPRIPLARIVALTAVDKLYSLVSALALGAAGAALLASHLREWPPAATLCAALLPLLLLPALPLLAPRRPVWRGPAAALPPVLLRLLRQAAEPLQMMPRADRYHLLVRTLVFHAAFILQLAVLLAAFGWYDATGTLTTGAALLFVKTIVPVGIPGDLGVREATTVAIAIALGGAPAAAFNASVILFVINIALPSLAGALLLVARPQRVDADLQVGVPVHPAGPISERTTCTARTACTERMESTAREERPARAGITDRAGISEDGCAAQDGGIA